MIRESKTDVLMQSCQAIGSLFGKILTKQIVSAKRKRTNDNESKGKK
jgi:hypothetical protein